MAPRKEVEVARFRLQVIIYLIRHAFLTPTDSSWPHRPMLAVAYAICVASVHGRSIFGEKETVAGEESVQQFQLQYKAAFIQPFIFFYLRT